MDAVQVYNEFKSLSFPQGYWVCNPESRTDTTLNFTAVVVMPYVGSGDFEILLNNRIIPHAPATDATFVRDRVSIAAQGVEAISFTIEGGDLTHGGVLTCRHSCTGSPIGSPYYIPNADYQSQTKTKSRNMLRSVRTDNDLYFQFTGYDDCQKLTQIIKSNFPARAQVKVLDWGVGSGRVSVHMRTNPLIDLFGTDIDPVNIQSLYDAGYPKSKFLTTEPGGSIPFGDGSFDACFGVSVFTHLTEELQFKYLAEIHRILRDDGVGIFSIHGLVHFFSRINDGNTFFDWIDSGILVTGDNFDISENFDSANSEKLYVDTLHTPSYIMEAWGRLFRSVQIITAPNSYGHDLVVCRK